MQYCPLCGPTLPRCNTIAPCIIESNIPWPPLPLQHTYFIHFAGMYVQGLVCTRATAPHFYFRPVYLSQHHLSIEKRIPTAADEIAWHVL
jgi:hypothetical protein